MVATKLDETLASLHRELQNTEVRPGEWVIFGSTSLVLWGVLDRTPGDIDIFVSKRVWGALLAREGWFVETPKAGDPPILSNETTEIPIHAFFDWSDEAVHMDVPYLLGQPHYVYQFNTYWPVIAVEEALRHKEAALAHGGSKVQKHVPDIAIINEWLADHYKEED